MKHLCLSMWGKGGVNVSLGSETKGFTTLLTYILMDVASSPSLHDFWFLLLEFGTFKKKKNLTKANERQMGRVFQCSIKGENFTKLGVGGKSVKTQLIKKLNDVKAYPFSHGEIKFHWKLLAILQFFFFYLCWRFFPGYSTSIFITKIFFSSQFFFKM